MSLGHLAKIALHALNPRSFPVPKPAADEPHLLGASLPAGFLLGAATSSHQIEGQNENDWTEWEKGIAEDGSRRIKDGRSSEEGPGSWSLFESDLQCLKALGANTYRFSIEWSRVEPERGRFDQRALDQYLRWCEQLRALAIEPMVTLHHFTLPRWISSAGGWESEETIGRFVEFTRQVVARLAPAVDLWCTINEPNVQAFLGYHQGIWPPGKKDPKVAIEVFGRLLVAHARAAQVIREVDRTDADGDGRPALIGIAHHVRVLQPWSRSPFDRFVAAVADDFVNEAAVRAARTGVIEVTIPGTVSYRRQEPALKGSMDYLGLNYYSRDHLKLDLKSPSLSQQFVPEGRPKSDLGWEIYPDGLYLLLKRYGQEGLPIYVTENGIDDRSGQKRTAFLREHLAALERAVREGVDVRGYCHWSLIDNFEWAEGLEPRFGLFRVDYAEASRPRSPTPAVSLFAEVAQRLKTRR